MRLHVKIAILVAALAVVLGVFFSYVHGKRLEAFADHYFYLRVQNISQQLFANSLVSDSQVDKVAKKLKQLVASETDIDYMYLLGEGNKIIAHSFSTNVPSRLFGLPLEPFNKDLQRASYISADKAILHIAMAVPSVSNIYLHIGFDAAAVDSYTSSMNVFTTSMFLLILLLAVSVAFVLVKRTTGPISKLADQMRMYGLGRSPTIPVLTEDSGSYEAQLLTNTFQKMLGDREKIEHALSRREAEFKAMFNSINDAVTFAGVDRKMRLCNPAMEELFGYSSEELIGNSTEMLYADPADYQKQGQRRYRKGEDVENVPYEVRYRKHDGSVFLSETRGTHVKEPGGKLIGFFAMIRDITEQKRQREELNQFKSTLDDTLDCVFMFRADTLKFFYVNRGAVEQVGYSSEELLSKTPVDIKPLFNEQQFRELLEPLLQHQRKSLTFETVHEHKDGSQIPVEIFLQYIDPQGETPRFVAVVRDLTERKQAEQELRKHRDHLEELVQQRTAELEAAVKELEAFSYSVSHDLRSPLRAIDGFSQALMEDYEGKLDDSGKWYLSRIRSGAQRLASLIDDLLQLARVSRSQIVFEDIELSEMAKKILNEFANLETQRQVEIAVAPKLRAQGDPGLIHIVLQNLLGNAWKYTGKEDEAHIEFGRLDSAAENTFFIRDNGVGFDMQYADKLFGAFQRLHRVDEFEGTGIGLATVDRIISRHGGRVWAEAQPDKGATFYFTLPRADKLGT
ncbi:sensor histidine kinase [Kaarinaea lacus]